MADGDVKYRFFADAQAAERAIVGLERKYEGLENKINAVARSSKKSNSDGVSGFQQLSNFATTVIGKFGSVAIAGAAISAAVSRVTQELDRATEAEREFGKSFLQNMSLTGKLSQAPAIREFAENLAGVTSDQAAAAFGGVASGAPFMDVNRQKAIAAQVAKLAPLIAPAEVGKTPDTSVLSTLASVTAELGDAFDKKSPQDTANLAWAAFAKSGSKFQKLDSAAFERVLGPLSQQFGPEGAMARIVTALDEGIEPRGMSAKGVFGKLDPAKIQATVDEFTKAQRDNIIGRDLQASIAASPTTMLNQMAAAKHEKRTRSFAQSEAFVDAIEEMEHMPGLRGIPDTLIEGARETAKYAVGHGGGPMDAGSQAWLRELLEKQLALQARTLSELEKQGQQNRPAIRRDAQGE